MFVVRNTTLLLAAIIIPLLSCGCSDRTRRMTFRQFRELSDEERMKAQRELSPDELQNILTVAAGSRYDSAGLDRRTLQELIVEGEKIRERIEPTPPTR